MNTWGEIILTILVYRPPGGQRDVFMYQFLQKHSMLEEAHNFKTILCGDFNCDQIVKENVDAFQQLCKYLNFTQCVK